MNTLRLECPATGREVESGITTYPGTRLISVRIRCPVCEGLHEFQVADGDVGMVISAHCSNGARVIKPQSALPMFQNSSKEIVELREQLLDELNHRLANNLQILHGLLEIARRKTD